MKKRYLISFLIVLALIYSFNTIIVKSQPNNEMKRFSVLFYDESDPFISLIKVALQEIQQSNPNQVEFTYYDARDNQETQNHQLEEVLNNNLDGIFINIVDFDNSDYLVNRAKEKNIPIIFFNREPRTLDGIRSYGKSLYIGTSGCEFGAAQGEMIVNQMKNNFILDKNLNNQLDYILLKGPRDDAEATERSACVLQKIRDSGITVNELYSEFMNWDRETAKERVTPVLSRVITNVDAIISNNDAMAIGAIEALQSYGYNLGDKRRYVPVFGIDGIPEALTLIELGLMEGTVIQDAKAMAEAMYLTGMNLAKGKDPLEGTNYHFDATGVAIRVPYPKYTVTSHDQ